MSIELMYFIGLMITSLIIVSIFYIRNKDNMLLNASLAFLLGLGWPAVVCISILMAFGYMSRRLYYYHIHKTSYEPLCDDSVEYAVEDSDPYMLDEWQNT